MTVLEIKLQKTRFSDKMISYANSDKKKRLKIAPGYLRKRAENTDQL